MLSQLPESHELNSLYRTPDTCLEDAAALTIIREYTQRSPTRDESSYAVISQTDVHAEGESMLDAEEMVDKSSNVRHPNKRATSPSHSSDEPESPARVSKRLPVHISWTSRVALLLAGLALIACVAAVLLLWSVSLAQGGFTISSSTSPYTYKYGPTAIMTIVLTLWRQVDRAMRLDAPWLEMTKGHTVAARSVLLDYTSPILPSALWTAIRNRHWRVSGTIFVYGLVKLAILFSTGLLVVRGTLHTKTDVSFTLKRLSGARSGGDISNFYDDELYANMRDNVTFPPGVTEKAAFQELDDQNNQHPAGSIVTAQVLAFFPDLECYKAKLNFTYSQESIAVLNGAGWYVYSHTMSVNFSSAHCNGSLAFAQPGCSHQNWTSCDFESTYVGSTVKLCCAEWDKAPNYPGQVNSLLFTLVKITKDPSSPDTGGSRVLWSSAVLCRPKYAVETALLTVNTSNPFYPGGKTLSPPTSSKNRQISGYSSSNLTAEVDTSTASSFDQSVNLDQIISEANPDKTVDYTNLDAWFQLMLELKQDYQLDHLRQMSTMVNYTTALFKALTAQSVATWLSFPDHLVTNGSYVFSEQRLLVQPSAAWEMCAVLVFALIVVVALIRFTPKYRHGSVRRPTSLTALTISGIKSQTLVQLLGASGHKTDAQLLESLSFSKFAFSRSNGGKLRLEATKEERAPEDSFHDESLSRYNMKWWAPVSAQSWFAGLCLLVPLAEIAMLEVLQRKSRAQGGQGLCDTHQPFETVHTLVSLLTAGIMLLTATLYSSTEFTIAALTPYYRLKKETSRLKRVNQNPSHDLAPVAIAKCIAHGEYAASAMLLSTTLASVLTVIVSGLYAIAPVTKPYGTNIATADHFNLSWNQTDADGSNTDFELLETHNLSWPSGIFETFAYPQVQLDRSETNVARVLNEGNSTHLDVTLPVTRASLNCSLVPESEKYYGPMIVYYHPDAGFQANMTGFGFGVTKPLPKQCQFSSGLWQSSTELMVNASSNAPSDRLWARVLPLTTTDWTSDPTMDVINDYPPGCPSVAFVVGNFPNDTYAAVSMKNWTAFICTQQQEEVPALLRFSVPGLELDPSFTPRLDETQAKVVSAYQYDFRDMFQVGGYPAVGNYDTDSFYGNVMGYTGLTLDDMAGPGHEELLFNATQLIYQYYMALTFNRYMRVGSPEIGSSKSLSSVTQAGSTFPATLYDPMVIRISQENTSKVILQVLLSIMVVCYMFAHIAVDLRHTLPHNPCSIAGTLSLLLGGNFAKEVSRLDDEGLGEDGDCGDKSTGQDGEDTYLAQRADEIVAERMADTRLRLAWWETEPGQPARFGIDMVTPSDGEERGALVNNGLHQSERA